MIFCIEIAELIIEIHSLYDKVYDYCKDYIVVCHDKPDIVIHISQKDILEEKRIVLMNYEVQRRNTVTNHTDKMLEVSAVHRKIADALIEFDRLVMHGAVVAWTNEDNEDEAIIFTAKSGVGKTTHSNLWIDNLEGAYILNGDKPVIKLDENGLFVYGSPWQGKERQGCNRSAKVKAICFLQRDEDNVLENKDPKDIFISLFKQCHRPKGKQNMLKLMDMLERFDCKFYTMRCNNYKKDVFLVASRIIIGS